MRASSRVRGNGPSIWIQQCHRSVTVRATKIYIKMEEKTQAAERESKKDEIHEKDARNKRYAAEDRLVPPGIRLRRDRDEAHFAIRRPVLTYIRFTNNPIPTLRDSPTIFQDFSVAIRRGTRTFLIMI